MDQATQASIGVRIAELLEAKTTHVDGGEAVVDAARYVDPARFAVEKERLFRRHPVAAAHASQLARPGDYLTHDGTGTPILLTRTADGAVAAHVNACRHRGTRLVCEAEGRNRQAFVCPYHGWTYDGGGRLRAVPHEHGFPSGPSSTLRLEPVTAAERAGLIFVQAEGGAPDGVDRLLAPLRGELEGWKLGAHVRFQPQDHVLQLNWKIAIEIFLEAYHLKVAHARSIYPLFFDNLGLSDSFEPHVRGVFPKRTITDALSRPTGSWALRDHANILYFLFPNALVLVEPDHLGVLLLQPVDPHTTALHTFLLIPEAPATEKAERYWQKNHDVLLGAVREDVRLGESIQAGMRAGAVRQVRFGRFEHGLRYFAESVDRRIAAAAPPWQDPPGGT
ncbi:MAG TPA: SRPBCC family protein [Myxococcales bacterium]|nr:SRPBCC family protein [Myxococcales bacterium]